MALLLRLRGRNGDFFEGVASVACGYPMQQLSRVENYAENILELYMLAIPTDGRYGACGYAE